MLKQIAALTRLSILSLPQRWAMSLATIFAVAMVVAVLLAFLSMANGFRATLQSAGSDMTTVVLRKGSQSELNSILARSQVRLLTEAPGIARDASGNPIVSAELFVIVDGKKRTTNTEANLPLRGVSQNAVHLRQNFSIVEGRMFTEGSNEMIVGQAILNQFAGFDLGQEVKLGANRWRVVGVFSTGGNVFESELWADAPVLQNLYQRGSTFQTFRAKLDGDTGIKALREWAENEPQVELDIQTEKEFFADQAGTLTLIINFVGWFLGSVMALGALAGAWNTLYASVDARTREIATLRTIGFNGFSAFVATLFEALLLSFVGGLLGSALAYLMFNGINASTLGAGFSQVAFSFEVTLNSILMGVALSLAVGFLGGLAPSIRAARTPLLAAQ